MKPISKNPLMKSPIIRQLGLLLFGSALLAIGTLTAPSSAINAQDAITTITRTITITQTNSPTPTPVRSRPKKGELPSALAGISFGVGGGGSDPQNVCDIILDLSKGEPSISDSPVVACAFSSQRDHTFIISPLGEIFFPLEHSYFSERLSTTVYYYLLPVTIFANKGRWSLLMQTEYQSLVIQPTSADFIDENFIQFFDSDLNFALYGFQPQERVKVLLFNGQEKGYNGEFDVTVDAHGFAGLVLDTSYYVIAIGDQGSFIQYGLSTMPPDLPQALYAYYWGSGSEREITLTPILN